MPQNNPDSELQILIMVICVLLLIPALIGFILFLNGFSHELKYINIEINRTTGEERKFWIRRRRRLWLSIIPFVKY